MMILGALLLGFGMVVCIGSIVLLFATDEPMFVFAVVVGWMMVLGSIAPLAMGEEDEYRKDCKQYATGLQLQQEWNDDQGCLLILPDGRKIKDEQYKVGG